MKSRAALLAEIEENRLKNRYLSPQVDELGIIGDDLGEGYDPYDCPGRDRAAAGHRRPFTTQRER